MPRERQASASGELPKWTMRPMRPEDIDKCLAIWKDVELTEAYHTVASALETDPNGFYVSELDSTGEVIGMCAGPMCRHDTAFMGFYAVDPRYQGIGIGRELWAKTTSRFDESTINVGLYGVPAMSAKYKKSGFKVEDSIRMLIYESDPNGELHPNRLADLKDISSRPACSLSLVRVDCSASEELFRKLVDYDQSVHTYSREKLLRNYLWRKREDHAPITFAVIRTSDDPTAMAPPNASPNSTSASRLVGAGERKSSCCAKPSQESILEDETLSTSMRGSLSISANNLIGELHTRSTSPIDIPSVSSGQHQQHQQRTTTGSSLEVLGYGCIRHDNTSGGIIGPLYADSDEICELILRNLLASFKLTPGAKYSVMALSSNQASCNILGKLGLTEMDQCSRMFTKYVPSAQFSKIYYVHSPNFTLF